MTNVNNHHTWLSSIGISGNITIYLFLICVSFVWNAYNTYQYQILIQRQSKLENIFNDISPSISLLPSFNQLETATTKRKLSVEQWFIEVLHFIQQLRSNDRTNNSYSDTSAKPYTVRIVFVEMLIENLDTCIRIYIYIYIYACGSCQRYAH